MADGRRKLAGGRTLKTDATVSGVADSSNLIAVSIAPCLSSSRVPFAFSLSMYRQSFPKNPVR